MKPRLDQVFQLSFPNLTSFSPTSGFREPALGGSSAWKGVEAAAESPGHPSPPSWVCRSLLHVFAVRAA